MARIILFLFWLPLLASANDSTVSASIDAPTAVGEFQGEESVIRMVSEKIDITFGKSESKVKCRFVFRSTKPDSPAVQLVGFPDLLTEQPFDVSSITSMVTRVNGKEIPAKKEKGFWGNGRGTLGKVPEGTPGYTPAEFYVVEVSFPPDQDVIIERDYTVENGGSVMGDSTFAYATFTGAVWKDTIGRAEINVTLDGWTLDDLAFEDGPQKIEPREQGVFSSPNLEDWKVESPTKLSLVWENFEPAVHTTRRGIFLTTWKKRS